MSGRPRRRLPRTSAEWQEAVDLAEVMALIHSARAYGLIAGGPEVNVDRCLRILKRGRELGIVPAADCVERIVPAFVRGGGPQ
jgi:hypothetical protein